MMINKSYIFLLVMVISSCGLFNKENNAVLVKLEEGKYQIITKYDIISAL